MQINNKPIHLEVKYNENYYNKQEFNDFFENNNIKYISEDIKGKSLYLINNTVSQTKLRDSGFIIKRDVSKADVIVISDYYKLKSNFSYLTKSEVAIHTRYNIEHFFNTYNQYNSYILDTELYKYLYKYDGNQELFIQCSDLLKSRQEDNIRIAMEFMSNANWETNEIYLQELFNLYWFDCIRRNNYKDSISFKGFLNSLSFPYMSLRLNEANDYRELCTKQEHHEWLYNKYIEEFQEELDFLFVKHKIKLDKIEFSIDKTIF